MINDPNTGTVHPDIAQELASIAETVQEAIDFAFSEVEIELRTNGELRSIEGIRGIYEGLDRLVEAVIAPQRDGFYG